MNPTRASSSSVDGAVLYCRPGCGYCATLRRQLRRAGVRLDEVNIWDDREAAAVVRSVARGSETVPTVVVAGRALVNPRASDVIDALRVGAPHLLPPPAPDTGGRPRSWWRRHRRHDA